MRFYVRLPTDRTQPGEVELFDDEGSLLLGPFRCRGKADSAEAGKHGNPSRDSEAPFGDHPSGLSKIISVEHKDPAHFGPAFFRLQAIAGDALDGQRRGRDGMGMHGGLPMTDGSLRATFGCLRIDNDMARACEPLVTAALAAGRTVFFEVADV